MAHRPADEDVVSEPPRVAAGRLLLSLAHHRARQYVRDGQPPDRLPGTGPVQGPAQPTHTDLIWATASSQAALDDASLSTAERLSYLEAEAATYTAAAHLGVDGGTPEHYAAELEHQELATSALECS